MPQAPHPRRRRVILWSVTIGASVGLAILLAGWWTLRPAVLKPRIAAALSHHLQLDVEIGALSMAWRPRPEVQGDHLVFRVPNRPDLPPFITIDHFSMDVGLLSAVRRHVNRVRLEGMTIVVPPKRARGDLGGGGDFNDTSSIASKIVIDELDAVGTVLRFTPGRPDHRPLEFQIHELEVGALGFGRQMPFHTKLTNPIPEGLVESRGTFGPWPLNDPTALPVAGDYTLTNTDLGTIDGIGGRLSSTGKYSGRLTEIAVSGTTTSPDFSLDLGGSPVPLQTTFDAAVDATNGTVRLDRVDATLRSTPIHATGLIKNLPGPAGHAIDLDVDVANGRIEDLLRLASDAKTPLVTGNVSMRSKLSLPPGKTPVRQRLKLSGSFAVAGATFSGTQIQDKLHELSRRSQGKSQDEPMSRVVTDVHGDFNFARSRLAIKGLAFHVPGAAVDLGGGYTVNDGALDFSGTLTMQATVSQAIGGMKAWLLKPFDPLFRKNGAGAVVPITVTGTKDAPKFGLDMGRVFSRGKQSPR
jgi:hypothetical protein